MRQVKWVWLLIVVMGTVYGSEDTQKHSLKCNMTHLFEELPEKADSIAEMFSQGMFYGRLRFNSFGFKWKNEIDMLREDHSTMGIGGSLIYKSATLNGFGVTAGVYMTQGYGSLEDEEAYLYRAGKEVFSRYDLLTEGRQNITSLAQAYLEYRYKDVSVKAGRQIFVSFLTQSNDTKMIPNTFEGFTLSSRSIPDTELNMAYLTKQKLRDHSEFHHLLAYDAWRENDDSAMHRGLTLSELQAKGIEDRLIILQAKNESIENLRLRMNYTAVPELISSAMLQADYRFYLGSGSIIPALRIMQQFDNGAGEIGGANLLTLTEGYSDPDSLDAALFGARVDVVEDGFKLRFGYTKTADKGDIVAPWRAFPTAGFTRAMGQYNWYANTETYMIQLDYEFEIIPEFKIISRFAIQDFDDEKIGVPTDSKVFTLDFLKGLGETPLYLKTRFAHVMGDDNTKNIIFDGEDSSYDELRIEVNYLF